MTLDNHSDIDKKPVVDGHEKDVDVGEAVANGEHGEYQRSFTPRQIHMISLGGQIGAGLFVSTGTNLARGGPGSMLVAFAIVSSCVWAVLQTVSEMTIAFPISGNFIEYADRWVDPALAFAAGLSMWIGWTAIVAAEATFFAILVQYWAPASIHVAVWYTVFLVVMFIIFYLPNTWFGWFEYGTACMKIIALIIFVVTGFALVVGAGPTGRVHNGETWRESGGFKDGFRGFSSSLMLSLLAIGDNTFTGFLAGEAVSPRYSVAHAVFIIPIRISAIYLISVTFIGLLVSSDDNRLFNGAGVAASPFVIAIKDAGIKGLPDFLNTVIILAVASIGAESIFIASRMLRCLSHRKLIPDWVAQIDNRGRPRWAILITCVTAVALTYANLSSTGIEAFNWLSQITSTGYFMVWIVITVTNFRFRAALKAQDDKLFHETYAWACSLWPLPPIWLLICCTMFTIASLYLAVNGSHISKAYNFFQYMIGFIIIVVSGIAYKLIFRTKLRDLSTADLQTGRRPLSIAEIQELDDYNKRPIWRRFLTFVQLW